MLRFTLAAFILSSALPALAHTQPLLRTSVCSKGWSAASWLKDWSITVWTAPTRPSVWRTFLSPI